VLLVQDAVEQGGFAGTEKAGQYGSWNQCHKIKRSQISMHNRRTIP
jgi:hypothetical protein